MNIENEIYSGLKWKTNKEGTGNIFAFSKTTPTIYYIEYTNPDQIIAYSTLPREDEDPTNAPKLKVGIFRDIELAILACEWHDFQYASSDAEQSGKELIFKGSESIETLTNTLMEESDLDGDVYQLIDLLVDDHICPNGRPFRRAASYFPGIKTGNKQNSDGSWTISIKVPPKEMPIWISEASLNTSMVFGAVPIDEEVQEDSWQTRCGEAFTRSHALPRDVTFQEWLLTHYDKWNLISEASKQDSDAVVNATLETLKRLIGISSRKDLRTNRDAVDKLEKIDREYYRDMARGFGIYVPNN